MRSFRSRVTSIAWSLSAPAILRDAASQNMSAITRKVKIVSGLIKTKQNKKTRSCCKHQLCWSHLVSKLFCASRCRRDGVSRAAGQTNLPVARCSFVRIWLLISCLILSQDPNQERICEIHARLCHEFARKWRHI